MARAAQVRRAYLKPLEWVLTLLLGLVFGLLWWQVGRHVTGPDARIQDYVSIVFFFVAQAQLAPSHFPMSLLVVVVAQWSWAPMFTVLNNFPAQRDVLTRERASDACALPTATLHAAHAAAHTV